ncbi:DNA-3-methyladenine glycosylase [Ilumatobacter nonamiensis]|uniref:DNA-3-methyladenine glycosylase n=1 Tax=Ilumatobacter nonamiensis TaxID=467093 RepID=UPI000349AD14|nr:DNA-3-methyladenine glycosylase [Ilumatobacter nonamiensis]
MSPVERDWFERDALAVAPDLLNKLLRVGSGHGVVSGRIVETEAYLPDDPASHSFRGPTERNRVMFGAPGRLYVYLSYGIHRCANVVTGPEGSGQAVLIRAVVPVDGIDTMRERRVRSDAELANGPGKLCQALGIDLADNGVDLVGGDRVTIADDGLPPPVDPLTGPRIGISKAVDRPWRFRVPAC